MNPPEPVDQPTFRKYTWLWVLLTLFTLSSISVIVIGIRYLKKSGGAGGAPLGLARSDSKHAITPIDLTAFYDKSGSWNTGSEWQAAPRGSIVLGGVPFEMNGLLRLTGRSAKNDGKGYREEVNGIPVNRKFERLHVLHIVSYGTSQEGPYARITLRHADGSSSAIPMVYGQHGRDWHRPRYEGNSALGDPNSKVVWRGDYTSGRTLRIFKTTFTNPKPDVEVTAIDLASENASPNASILSMSTGPANLPLARDDPASLPEPEEIYDGSIQVTAVDSQDKPLPNVILRVNGTDSTGSFRTPDVVTDAKGECVIKHPGDSTRTLAVVASGDGIAMKTVRWGQRDGDIIPVKYKLIANRASKIGGVILDETGQPVTGVKVQIHALRDLDERVAPQQVAFDSTTVTNDAKGRWEFRSLPQNFSAINMVMTHPDFVEARYLGDGSDRRYGGERVKMADLLKNEAVFKMRRGVSVTGRVLNEQGEPISGAKVLLGDSRFQSNPTQARTDARGEFRVAGANPGSTYLTVQATGRAPESRLVDVSASMKPAEFKLKPGNVFKARVVDESGKPVRTVRVAVDMWQNRQTLELSGTTDSSGLVTITSAPESGMSGSIYKAGYMNMSGIQFVADGVEHTFTLRKSATITGTVVDAETKQPIERFEVTRGQSYGVDQVSWQNYNLTKGVEGSFSIKLDQQNMNMLLIEADEHLPLILSLATNTGNHVDIELKKGSGPKGLVVTPDGKPAANAYVAVISRGRYINVVQDKLTSFGDSESKPVMANTNGGFSLRSSANAERIVATHPSGFMEMDYSNFVSGATLKLQQWGSIEGVLKIGAGLGTNESLLLSSDAGLQFGFQDYKVTTDDQGRFSMAKIPPGERVLARLVSLGRQSWGHSHRQPVTVKAGEVTTVVLGGNGRTIIGKLALEDPSRTLDYRQSGHHSLNSNLRPPQNATREEYLAWNTAVSTAAARRNFRSYSLAMQEDGTFRVDDVLPGTYDLRIQLTEPNDGRGPWTIIGNVTTNVTIPEFQNPNPTAAPPMDLGTIIVPLARNARPNALLR